MTEEEWLGTDDPLAMLRFLFPESEGSETVIQKRKSKLYLVACCRNVWRELVWATKVTTEVVERVADGEVQDEALQMRCKTVSEDVRHWAYEALRAANSDEWRAHLQKIAANERRLVPFGYSKPSDPDPLPTSADQLPRFARIAGLAFVATWISVNVPYRWIAPELHSTDLLRDIGGKSFSPATIDRDWLTWNDGTVRKFAQTIYDDRRFDLLPILADALEEAGCDHADILTHCRGPGPHVRGCWVVDLLLDKA